MGEPLPRGVAIAATDWIIRRFESIRRRSFKGDVRKNIHAPFSAQEAALKTKGEFNLWKRKSY
jgi:hypothetical protein